MDVVFELILKDMEHFQRGWGEGFRQKQAYELSKKVSVLDDSVDLEYWYEEGVCFGGGVRDKASGRI